MNPFFQVSKVFCITAIGAACVAASPGAHGETGSLAPAVEEVIIQSQAPEVLLEYVQALAEPGPTGQLARWNGTICPQVLGIDSLQAGTIVQRIIDLAEPLNLSRVTSDCYPDITVLITDDPEANATALAEKHERELRQDGQARLKRFLEPDQPVRWISVIDECGFGCTLSNSRIRMSTAPAFDAMVIIVDANKLAGHGLDELADYVALVALADPSPQSLQLQDSIMSMFDAPRSPGARYRLTDHDMAFLSSLYKSLPEAGYDRQQESIVRRMQKELEAR